MNLARPSESLPLEELSAPVRLLARQRTSSSPLMSMEYLLNGVQRALQAALDVRLASNQELGPLEVSAAQLVILGTLAAGEGVKTTDLCESLSYDSGAMTRMLDRLEVKGVIHRRRSPKDRRVVHVELTEEGRARLPRMRAIAMEVRDGCLEGFSSGEVRQLKDYLSRLLLNVQTRLEGCDQTRGNPSSSSSRAQLSVARHARGTRQLTRQRD